MTICFSLFLSTSVHLDYFLHSRPLKTIFLDTSFNHVILDSILSRFHLSQSNLSKKESSHFLSSHSFTRQVHSLRKHIRNFCFKETIVLVYSQHKFLAICLQKYTPYTYKQGKGLEFLLVILQNNHSFAFKTMSNSHLLPPHSCSNGKKKMPPIIIAATSSDYSSRFLLRCRPSSS